MCHLSFCARRSAHLASLSPSSRALRNGLLRLLAEQYAIMDALSEAGDIHGLPAPALRVVASYLSWPPASDPNELGLDFSALDADKVKEQCPEELQRAAERYAKTGELPLQGL